MKVLIMDDEEFIREFMMEVLQMMGHDAVEASKGEEAVAIYEKAYHSEEPFDILFLDLTVCFGLGGEETIKKIKEFDPNARAVVLSGHKTGDLYHNYRNYGFSDYVLKPVELTEIERIMNELENIKS